MSKIQIGFDGPAQPQCTLTTKKDKSVDVAYTAPVAGEYKIHVKYDDKAVTGSPFKCKIIGDVKAAVGKVKVSGAVKEGKVNKENDILIDGREVGILGRFVYVEKGGESWYQNDQNQLIVGGLTGNMEGPRY